MTIDHATLFVRDSFTGYLDIWGSFIVFKEFLTKKRNIMLFTCLLTFEAYDFQTISKRDENIIRFN